MGTGERDSIRTDEQRLKEEIQDFWINMNTDKRALEDYLKASGDDSRRCMERAEELLQNSGGEIPHRFGWPGYRLLEIGVPKGLEEKSCREQRGEMLVPAKKLAMALNALDANWELIIKKQGIDYKLEIGIEKKHEAGLPCLLRAAYQHCLAEKVQKTDPPPARKKGVLRTWRTSEEKNGGEERQEELLQSLACAVHQAHFPGDYEVRLVFAHMSRELLNKRLKELELILEKLSPFEDINVQVSSQLTTGYNQGSGKTIAIKNDNSGKSDTGGKTVSFSGTRKPAGIKSLAGRVEEEMKLTQKALGLGGWCVFAEISAGSEAECDMILAVVNGVLMDKRCRFLGESENQGGSLFVTGDIAALSVLPSTELPGFSIYELQEFSLNPCRLEPDFHDGTGGEEPSVTIGNVVWNRECLDTVVKIAERQFKRHVFICGMTGAGKTNTVFRIIQNLKRPFLVIEPVKSEYSALKSIYPDMKIITMGADSGDLLQFNPFWFPQNGSIQYHMDVIKSAITSAFSLTAAMPNILEQCITQIYIKKGWFLENGTNIYEDELPLEMLYPTMEDLYLEVDRYIETSYFEGENKATYRGALTTRLKSFLTGVKGVIFNNTRVVPFEEWLTTPHVIVLDALSDDADKSIVMSVLIMQFFQYLKATADKSDLENLRHLLVIEEAHRLFKREAGRTQSMESADSNAKLVNILSDMMAEIRAYGEGVMIIDQSPTRVADDVIKNSNVKIVHRLDFKDDVENVENCLVMEHAAGEVASLGVGEMLLRHEGMNKPLKVKVARAKTDNVLKQASMTLQKSKKPIGSSFADFIMQNQEFCRELSRLADCVLNHMLVDSMERFYLVLDRAKEQLDEILSHYGYGAEILRLADNDYMTILKRGLKHYLTEIPENREGIRYYDSYKFSQLAMIYFDRICESILCQCLYGKYELRMFEAFRKVRIYPVLKGVFYNTYREDQVNRYCADKLFSYNQYTGIAITIWRGGMKQAKAQEDMDFWETCIMDSGLFLIPVSPFVLRDLARMLRELAGLHGKKEE